jgi:hypothetical protein
MEIVEVQSLMCKWWFISQKYKIESTYSNVIFFNTCKNFQDIFFLLTKHGQCHDVICIQTTSYSLVNGIGHYAFG